MSDEKMGHRWDRGSTASVPRPENSEKTYGTLKALARQVLNSSVRRVPHLVGGTVGQCLFRSGTGMGQGWDSGEEPAISEPSTDAAKEAFLSSEVRPRDETKHTKEDLEASRVRLEAAGVNIAIWDDGSMRIVVSEPERTKAIDAGGTIYSPEDMLHYVELDQRERRLLHQFRKHFGGIVEWPPRASAQPKTLWPFKPHGRATTI